MFNVYYTYDEIRRLKVYKGFECKKFHVNSFVENYENKEDALKHPVSEKEKEFPKGAYLITSEMLPAEIDITPEKVIDKKKKKK